VLTRGIALIPHFEKAYSERARARLALGRVDAALRDLEEAVRVNHRHNSFWSWTAPLTPLDDERFAVLKLLSAHAERRPRSARAWAWLGEALTQAGLFDEGLLALDRALVLEPERPWLRSWRGEALLRLGRLPEAELELERAVRRDPHDGRARCFRGRVRFLRGRPADAVADLEKAAADSMIEYSWAYHWRAEAKEAAGDRAGARADAETAVALEPRRPEFRALRERLSRGRAEAA
jgi:tetratricopeptide (TPR) repeat protein